MKHEHYGVKRDRFYKIVGLLAVPQVVQAHQFGGGRGIRTLGAVKHTCFRDKPVKPLLHLSNMPILTENERVAPQI